MSDWVGVLLICVLLVAVVGLGVLLFFLWQEQQHKQERSSEEFPVSIPVESPAPKPRIVLRRQQVIEKKFQRRRVGETTFKRKQILGNTQKTTTIPIMPDWLVTPTQQSKIKAREVKIELDEIHKVTGIAIRDCPCPDCQEMRANVGS